MVNNIIFISFDFLMTGKKRSWHKGVGLVASSGVTSDIIQIMKLIS